MRLDFVDPSVPRVRVSLVGILEGFHFGRFEVEFLANFRQGNDFLSRAPRAARERRVEFGSNAGEVTEI